MATLQVAKRAHKEYAHLMKPLLVQEGPPGLYPEPLVWMEGKDMEGFSAQFWYEFIKAPRTCHPVEGTIIHPYDECLIFAGNDVGDIRHLGAEISITLGEEREEHTFMDPTVVLIPKGTPHGPVKVSKVERPIVHYGIALAPEYKASILPKQAATAGSRHSHLIKRLRTDVSRASDASGMGYTRMIDEYGVMHPIQAGMGPGNADQLVWLYGNNLEGMDVNFTWGFYSGCGKWHRGGEVHTHPQEEILVFVGLDPNDINYLGAELEVGMGYEIERHIFNKPTVAICPKGFPHLPVVVRWVDKPYGFIVLNLCGEHDSPWVEA